MSTRTGNKFEELLKQSGVKIDSPPISVIDRVKAEMTPKKKVYDIPKTSDKRIASVLHAFLNTDEQKKRMGSYFIDGNELYYRIVTTSYGKETLEENLIAIKAGESIIGNSAQLSLIGRRVSFGHVSENRNETEIQRCLSLMIPMIPFSVFEQAKLNINNYKLIEKGPEEILKIKEKIMRKGKEETVIRERHFTGASLFSVDDSQFLFDADRREVEHGIFNAFLVKLPVKCNTIQEAYDALKPDSVKKAEGDGKQVKRQGEFFFIPVDSKLAEKLETYDKSEYSTLTLRAGNNRPNTGRGLRLLGEEAIPEERNWEKQGAWADKYSEKANSPDVVVFLTGKIEHSGREHAALILKSWYTAVANTATESFTITGDVD